MSESLKIISSGLVVGFLIAIMITLAAIASDVSSIKDFLDPAKHCAGEILWNEQFDIWECK